MKRKLLSLLLALSMVFALLPTAAFAQDEGVSAGNTINYVSLGDSMTNGYGLNGYNGNSGVADYGDGSYTNQFAAWLKTAGYADEVNHFQLALSAMRAEDLHWLLEVDYTDEAVLNLIDEMDQNYRNNKWGIIHAAIAAGTYTQEYVDALDSSKKAYFEAYADRWNEVFSNGDSWTWRELIHDYRFNVCAVYIKYYEANPTASTNVALDYEDADGNPIYSDVEALQIVAEYFQNAVANADIVSNGIGNGNFGVFILGRIQEAIGFSGGPTEALIYRVEDAIRECDPAVQEMILALRDELYAKLAEYVDMADEMMAALVNSVVYGGLSYVLNWCGATDAIVELNPDAEIIVMGLMNTMNGIKMEIGGVTIDVGQCMSIMLDSLNSFMAGYPAVMQALGHYEDATFYYAEERQVECYADTYNDTIKDGVIRDRFVQSIVGDEGDELIWNSIRPIAKSMGTELQTVTLAQIQGYEAMSDVQKIGYAQADGKTAMSIALYLAAEKAVLQVLENGGTMSADAAVALGNGTLTTDSVVALFEQKLAEYTPKYSQQVINAIGADNFNALSSSQKQMLVALFAMPDALGEALAEDQEIGGLLNLYAHCLLGNGLSGHPSQGGHDQLAAAIIEAYAAGHTVQDEVVERLVALSGMIIDLIGEYYDEAYADLYQLAASYGYVDAAAAALEMAKLAVESMDLDSLCLTDDLKAELEEEAALVIRTIEALQNLLYTADELDADTFAAAEQLVGTLGAAIENVNDILSVAGTNLAAQITKQLGILNDELRKLVSAALEQAKTTLEELKTLFDEEIAPAVCEQLRQLITELEAQLSYLQAVVNNQIEAACEEVYAAILRTQELVAQMIEAAKEDADALAQKLLAELENLVNEIIAKFEETIYDATHLEVGCLVKYAAINGNYVEELVLASLTTSPKLIPITDESQIGEAELVSYQMTGNAIAEAIINLAYNLNMGREYAAPDWSVIFDTDEAARILDETLLTAEEAASYVAMLQNMLANELPEDVLASIMNSEDRIVAWLEAMLAEFLEETDIEATIDALYPYVETLTYHVVYNALETVATMNRLNEINPNANILLVGMYNPLTGATVTMNGNTIDLGELFDYVVNAFDFAGLIYAMVDSNVTYVSAMDATVDSIGNLDIDALLAAYADFEANGTAALPALRDALNTATAWLESVAANDANDEGKAYIVEQILAALVAVHADGVVVDAVDATCTENGYTGDTVCPICGELLEQGEVIPATGHHYTDVVTEPTCTEQGYTTHTCECGESYTDNYVDALGHDWDQGVVTTEPTATTDGVKTFTCGRCGATRTETIPATGGGDSGIGGGDDSGIGGGDDTPIPGPVEEGCDGGADCPSRAFTDLASVLDENPTIWWHEATDYVIENGLMIGCGNDLFQPDTTTSRAMIVTILYRLEGSPAVTGTSEFSDVPSDLWYTDAVIWATENGIVKGCGDGTFAPTDVATREQIAVIFYRYAQYRGMDVSATTDLESYPDCGDISVWALDAMKWANASGLMIGRADDQGHTTLAPAGEITRSEMAMLLYRWCTEFAK